MLDTSLLAGNAVIGEVALSASSHRPPLVKFRPTSWVVRMPRFVCVPQYSESLKREKIECLCVEKSLWVAYIISFYYYYCNIEMSIYRHHFLMNKAVR